MKHTFARTIPALLVVVAFAVSAFTYSSLPDRIPTHWNASGEIDGYMPKPLGPFLGPLLLAATWLVLAVAPAMSPKGYLIDDFRGVYDALVAVVMLFLFGVTSMSILAGLGYDVDILPFVSGGLGLLFLVLGNYLGKVKRNFFIGIRTPWTLADEEVWLRTHRLGGRVFFAAGLAVILLGFLGTNVLLVIPILVMAALVPVIYSYLIYRRLDRAGRIGV